MIKGARRAAAAAAALTLGIQTSATLGFFSLPVCSLAHHVYLHVTVLRPGTNI